MNKDYRLDGLDCANCAMKIEKKVQTIEGVKEANVNFTTGKLRIVANEADLATVETKTKQAIKEIEPDVAVSEITNNHQDGDGHNHEHDNSRNDLLRILISALGMGLLIWFSPTGIVRLIGYLLIYGLIGFDVIKKAVMNITKGQIFDENFLMAIATIGAMIIGEYPEAVAVMLFYQVGEYFQGFAVKQSRRSIRELMAIRPDTARVQTSEGWKNVSPEAVELGQQVLIKPGERVPLDGKIIEGESMVDTSALTGESVPRKVTSGEMILSGFINKNQPIVMSVEKTYGESTISKLLELVENASSKKAPAENFITKFARYYTPIVVVLAVLLAIVPPLVVPGAVFSEWIYRALTFLVISCPCALVISVPLSFFGGIGGASKIGVLVKGSNYLELLAETETVVFDKTGTLTKGEFSVQTIETTMDQTTFMQYVASAEQYSTHPIAQSVLAAYQGPLLVSEQVEEIAGEGISAVIDAHDILVGNQKLMARKQIAFSTSEEVGTLLYVAIDQKYVGFLLIADALKEDAIETMNKLRKAGVKETVMLTGDAKKIADSVGKKVGIDQVYSELLPQDKVDKLEMILAKSSGKVAFVGDGINDAPVLARADVGIAMGGLGSDAAIEAADVVIMNDEPSKIADAMRVARKTLRIVKQNIVFAIGVKVLVLLLGALGFASMGDAVFADVGVTVIAVLNAMRCLRVKKLNE
ncbi:MULTISPECIES: heavy metal translocating P-type ATPase [Enterococcus]|uniref:Cd(2+)-exporting ATPase n=1 Tax=Enterococcus thailandicus TaxID=417368 RepID=A0A510WEN8_ENTTH|nr:heavy metal translocating P-type ATPase [Enterococcus thailandicus]MDK4352334.1 heavy metal translocating P-type ATPase [Enterococcus thailandicus]MDT2734700.1 heavy metal translocating P-type ATPase [Enterococcus thailandicus]MDT2845364.1 heavy metal translocating P-type ATPase [Enterococcus thailandicus]MEA4830851.1 heavy metal translocating P-type ATPase [Enterococcus thailandicus]OJG94207.1 cadmium-translocating P-type ATPase [Enterococcus thailandicus]